MFGLPVLYVARSSFILDEKEGQVSKNKPVCPELLDTLAKNVARLRKAKGLSQERLAEQAGMHRTFISMIERRGRNVTLGVVEALTKQLDVDVPTLLTEAPAE